MASSANTIVLEGVVAHRDAPRSTPGGVAALNLTLRHQSTQTEGNNEVAVEVEMQMVAFGETAKAMADVNAGDRISVKGFLSRKNRFSVLPILHITQYKFTDRG